MAAVIKDLAQVNADLQEQKERADTVDFKMITFSLAGKDYGVDIMNVKEIAKADKFTFVPNAASFVRGVYNLRGDIIPIIDLRNFFHMPLEKKADGQENMLILRINDQVYGTIVDKIDKVVGITHESIQPPHPIFGDINIKFISGVVEKDGALYIILDVVRIFGQNKEEKQKERVAPIGAGAFPPPSPVQAEEAEEQRKAAVDSAIGFIKEGLLALKHFQASPLNESWIRRRYAEWSVSRVTSDMQLRGASDADEFLSNFFSPCSDAFWDDGYADAVKGILPSVSSSSLQVWNIGCGKGYETYSLACILKSKYPNLNLKIWANDNDIMAISQAPNMVFDLEEVPEYCREYMVEGKSGFSFNQVIKDAIVFEYHDVLNDNPLPELDLIVARDLLSFFTEQDQSRMIFGFTEKLKSRALVILGKNEELYGDGWTSLSNDPVAAFVYNA
ncbi:MAG: chemotaxis protein CheW [Treponema sp.]|jgi:purine-binding chemotaxis protein CheW|nr:chemotaxis protein CheW [Treponema sp.]